MGRQYSQSHSDWNTSVLGQQALDSGGCNPLRPRGSRVSARGYRGAAVLTAEESGLQLDAEKAFTRDGAQQTVAQRPRAPMVQQEPSEIRCHWEPPNLACCAGMTCESAVFPVWQAQKASLPFRVSLSFFPHVACG